MNRLTSLVLAGTVIALMMACSPGPAPTRASAPSAASIARAADLTSALQQLDPGIDPHLLPRARPANCDPSCDNDPQGGCGACYNSYSYSYTTYSWTMTNGCGPVELDNPCYYAQVLYDDGSSYYIINGCGYLYGPDGNQKASSC